MQSQPIDFHPPATEAAPILLPVISTLFAERADRFSALATGHCLGEWLDFLSQLDVRQLQKLDAHGVCPCCGSLPVASIVRLGAEINNLRYLHCSLCNIEWNVSRATCTTCDTDKALALQEIEGSQGAVRAETCDARKSYLKIVYQEKDPRVDPFADDLATLPLDMLIDQAGDERSGPNLWLVGAYSS